MEEQIRVLFEMGTTPLIMGKRDTFESIVGSTSSQMIMAGVDKDIKRKYEVIEYIGPAGIPFFYLDNRTKVQKAQTNESFYKYLYPTTKEGKEDVSRRLKEGVIIFTTEKEVDSYINRQLLDSSKMADNEATRILTIPPSACFPPPLEIVERAAPTDKKSEEYRKWNAEQIRQAAKLRTFNQQEKDNERFWKEYKKDHSWFTGRKMHRRYEYNKRYGNVGKHNTKMIIYDVLHKLTGNEDEHVLPFGFMLIFGGGIARQVRTDIRTVYEQRMDLVGLGDFNKFVKEGRQDISLTSFHFNNPQSIMLMYILGIDTHEKQYNFCLNLYKINYYGYFLSEGKANSVKSDVIFLTLEEDVKTGKMIFRPSKTKINDFINLLERWSNTLNYEECLRLYEEQEKMKILHQESDDSTFYNYNEFTFSFLQKGWRISKPGDFNKRIATNNMTLILEKLCCYLNDYIEERIAFNIVMSHIMLKNEKPNTMSMTASLPGPMAVLAASTALSGSPPHKHHSLARNASVQKRRKDPTFERPLDKDIEQKFFEAYLSKNTIKPLDGLIKTEFLNNHKDDWNQLVEILNKYDANLPIMSGGKRKKKTRRKRRRKKKKRTRRKK